MLNLWRSFTVVQLPYNSYDDLLAVGPVQFIENQFAD